MSQIDWNGQEPDWTQTAREMAEKAENPPLKKGSISDRWDRAPSTFKAVVGGFVGTSAMWYIGGSAIVSATGILLGHPDMLPAATRIPLTVAAAGGLRLAGLTLKQSIQQKASWSRVGEIAQANIMAPVQKLKMVSLVLASLIVAPTMLGLAFLSKTTGSAKIQSLSDRLANANFLETLIDSIHQADSAKADAGAVAGARATWRLAHDALRETNPKAIDPMFAAEAFVKKEFDPRWPIGPNFEPFDQALERGLKNTAKPLEPEDAEFVQEVADIARALREAIDLRVSLKELKAERASEASAAVDGPGPALATQSPAETPKRRAARL